MIAILSAVLVAFAAPEKAAPLPDVAPGANKAGVRVVASGDKPLSAAVQIIGGAPATWNNGLLFSADAISPGGAYVGATTTSPVARGIDFSGVRFTDAALALNQWSAITFRNAKAGTSAIFTDDSSQLVLRAGQGGLRFIDVDSKTKLLEITADGQIRTKDGSLDEVINKAVEARLDHLTGTVRFLEFVLLLVVAGLIALAVTRRKKTA